MMHKEFSEGKITEKQMAKLFLKATESSKEQDIKEHWDLEVLYKDDLKKIDVKGLKKQNRYDPFPNENFHWVELENVLGGKNSGWVYGKADYIAFETNDYWIMVDRLALVNFIEKKVVGKIIEKTKDPYTLYQRSGRKDVVVKVKTIDLIRICDDILNKPENEQANNQE
jgi:hypothetical protein